MFGFWGSGVFAYTCIVGSHCILHGITPPPPLIGHLQALHGRGHQQCDGDPLLRGGLLAQRDRGDHQGAGPGGQGEGGLRASHGRGGRGFVASACRDHIVLVVVFVA